MRAGRLLLLLGTLSLACFAESIDIRVDLFAGGVRFDEIQIFAQSAGLQFDPTAPVTFDPGAFTDWSFNIETGTYVEGTGPETTGSTLTLALAEGSSPAPKDALAVRVYLLRHGMIVRAYDLTITASGWTVTAASADPAALELSQQQALAFGGVPPAMDGSTSSERQTAGGSSPASGGGSPAGGGMPAAMDTVNTAATDIDLTVPEPGPAALIAGALMLLAGLRRWGGLQPAKPGEARTLLRLASSCRR